MIALVSFLIILNLVISGCTKEHLGPTYGEKINPNDIGPAYQLNSVAILDKSLQRWEYLNDSNERTSYSKISVENLGIKRLPTRNVEVFTTIRNLTDFPLNLKIRSQFYDKNKVATEKPTAWKYQLLPKNSSLMYQERSLTIDRVENFLIEVKEGD